MTAQPFQKAEHWRVGQRVDQSLWQIKQAPGWRVAAQVNTLQEAAAWLTDHGADISQVAVLVGWPRKSLAEHVAEQTQPIQQPNL